MRVNGCECGCGGVGCFVVRCGVVRCSAMWWMFFLHLHFYLINILTDLQEKGQSQWLKWLTGQQEFLRAIYRLKLQGQGTINENRNKNNDIIITNK